MRRFVGAGLVKATSTDKAKPRAASEKAVDTPASPRGPEPKDGTASAPPLETDAPAAPRSGSAAAKPGTASPRPASDFNASGTTEPIGASTTPSSPSATPGSSSPRRQLPATSAAPSAPLRSYPKRGLVAGATAAKRNMEARYGAPVSAVDAASSEVRGPLVQLESAVRLQIAADSFTKLVEGYADADRMTWVFAARTGNLQIAATPDADPLHRLWTAASIMASLDALPAEARQVVELVPPPPPPPKLAPLPPPSPKGVSTANKLGRKGSKPVPMSFAEREMAKAQAQAARNELIEILHSDAARPEAVQRIVAELKKGTIVQKMSGKGSAKKVTLRISDEGDALLIEKRKIPIEDIQEIRLGTLSDTFARGGFSTSRGVGGHAFAVVAGAVTSLVCSTEADFKIWTQGLKVLMAVERDYEEAQMRKAWFSQAPEKHNNVLNTKELLGMLAYLNLKISTAQVRGRLDELHINGDRVCYADCKQLVRKLRRRLEFGPLFAAYATHSRPPLSAPAMNAHDLLLFLQREQDDDDITLAECEALIGEFSRENDNNNTITKNVNNNSNNKKSENEEEKKENNEKEEMLMDIGAFSLLMESEKNSAVIPAHAPLYEDMNQPLSDYYISSSHNTYLTGDQLRSQSSVEMYVCALKNGCKSLEIDIWDGSDGEPVVTHGHTLCSKISFSSVLKAIRDYAFFCSPYPLVLSFENHASYKQQVRMAEHLRNILGDLLLRAPADSSAPLPSPNALKGKILVKGKTLAGLQTGQAENDDEDAVDDVEEESVLTSAPSSSSTSPSSSSPSSLASSSSSSVSSSSPRSSVSSSTSMPSSTAAENSPDGDQVASSSLARAVMSASSVRVHSHLDRHTAWSMALSDTTSVIDVVEGLARKLQVDISTFCLCEYFPAEGRWRKCEDEEVITDIKSHWGDSLFSLPSPSSPSLVMVPLEFLAAGPTELNNQLLSATTGSAGVSSSSAGVSSSSAGGRFVKVGGGVARAIGSGAQAGAHVGAQKVGGMARVLGSSAHAIIPGSKTPSSSSSSPSSSPSPTPPSSASPTPTPPSSASSASSPDAPSSTSKLVFSAELSELTALTAKRFSTFDPPLHHPACECTSFGEVKAFKYISTSPDAFIGLNKKRLSRTYPKGARINSDNYSPVPCWNVGIQLVALNFQTPGRELWINAGKFAHVNGGCGYVLKPNYMRHSALPDASGAAGGRWRKLTIRILSARQLPRAEKGDVVDPYVSVSVVGAPGDTRDFRTKTVRNNGFAPQFDETFEFDLASSELAHLLLIVEDDKSLSSVQMPTVGGVSKAAAAVNPLKSLAPPGMGADTSSSLAYFSIPVEHLRPGWRMIPLYSCRPHSETSPVRMCNLFVHIQLDKNLDYGRFAHDQLRAAVTQAAAAMTKDELLRLIMNSPSLRSKLKLQRDGWN